MFLESIIDSANQDETFKVGVHFLNFSYNQDGISIAFSVHKLLQNSCGQYSCMILDGPKKQTLKTNFISLSIDVLSRAKVTIYKFESRLLLKMTNILELTNDV
jgi:hypothetical protein